MVDSSSRVRELAAEANAWLGRTKRGDEKIVTIKDGAPEWVSDLCHHAHGKMMPDDWRFSFVEDALTAIENDDADGPDLDAVYPYTGERLHWLASRNDRYGYCDQAAEDMGSRPDSILDWIAWGMVEELREVTELVRGRLEEMAEDEQDETDDE